MSLFDEAKKIKAKRALQPICRNCAKVYDGFGGIPDGYYLDADGDCYFCVPSERPEVKAYNRMIMKRKHLEIENEEGLLEMGITPEEIAEYKEMHQDPTDIELEFQEALDRLGIDYDVPWKEDGQEGIEDD